MIKMVYTSLENSKIKELSKLKDKKMRDNSNLFLVEGEHLVNEAFNHGYLKTLIKLIGYNYDLKVETLEVNEKILKNLSSLKNTPSLMGVCEKKHAFIGTNTCPRCGLPVSDKFSRIVGFYTPVSSYQNIRKKEFSMRKWYNVLNSDGMSYSS